MKKFEVKAGYYEWNIYYNDELLGSINDADGQLSEEIEEDTTYEDLEYIAYDWTDAIFEDLDESKFNRDDYFEIASKLTEAWAKHFGIEN